MADDFLNYAFEYWLKKGYAPHQAAALAGNAMVESNGNPGAVGDNGTARGVYQWRLDRQQRLNQRPDAKSIPGQLDFADWELNNTEKASGDALRNAKTFDEANNAVLGFLRPFKYTPQNPAASEAFLPRYNTGAGLLNLPQMSQVLATPPPTHVGPAPGIKEVAAYTPTNDVFAAADRTKDDADLGGHGSSPKLPDKSFDADKMQSAAGKLTNAGLGLLAAGEPPPPPSWIAQAMTAQPQVHRPQMQGGLLTDIFKDPEEEKRRRRMGGLLGDY